MNVRSISPSRNESAQVTDQPQQATNNTSSAGMLSRKGRLLATGLLAAVRANPATTVSMAVATGAAAWMRTNNRPDNNSVSIQPLGKNPRPHGIEVLVVDDNSHPGGHGDMTSFVVNSNIDKTQNIETLLLENGLSPGLCETLDDLIQISKMKNPPEVISMSLGSTPARHFEEHYPRVLSYFVGRDGEDKSRWPAKGMEAYKSNLEGLTNHILKKHASSMQMKCADGSIYSKKRADTFKALTNAGVTVVLCAGNDGDVEAKMNEVGLNVPNEMFKSIYYSHGEFLPDGVIVVGGSETLADGGVFAIGFSNPNPAVDVLADARHIQVNAEGGRASGTSFSAPKVAALAANILAINPRLKPAEVENIILSTASPLDSPTNRARMGVINESKALEVARHSLSNKHG
ncbi:MAG: S8/S53 family peptidase [Burkholderiales bacterium]|uniref:S8 family serine peptidase n=1 Tax=Limnobacter sp. TaxID=2003368 RepID=UPI003925B929|nr:S8/S53 family peptidase [Burkholderiales bacterium]